MGNAPYVYGTDALRPSFDNEVTLHRLSSASDWDEFGGDCWNGYNIRTFTGGKCGDYAYWRLNSDTLTVFGSGAMYDYDLVFQNGKYITTAPWSVYSGIMSALVIENGITKIGKEAFDSCGFTGNLEIPNSVVSIETFAFAYCNSFNGSLTIGSSVTSIGGCAFKNCSRFTGSLTIPDSVINIGISAFEGCSGFTTVLLQAAA